MLYTKPYKKGMWKTFASLSGPIESPSISWLGSLAEVTGGEPLFTIIANTGTVAIEVHQLGSDELYYSVISMSPAVQ
jgi:hypothetical protein